MNTASRAAALLLLARWQKRNETLRKRDAIRAISRIADVIGHQPVEAPFVICWREERAEAVEEAIFQRRRNGHLAPSLGGELVRFLCVAICKISRGEGCIAGACSGIPFGK